MKRLLITGVSVLAIGLAGCGTDTTDDSVEENTDAANPPVEQPLEPATGDTEENSSDDTQTDSSTTSTIEDAQGKMDKLSFQEIELEISYGNDQEYEAEIEQDDNEPVKAKVEDELKDVYLKDQEAFDELYPRVENLDLTKDSSDQETIDAILNAFNLQNDYEKFEVEITFNDRSKLEVEERK